MKKKNGLISVRGHAVLTLNSLLEVVATLMIFRTMAENHQLGMKMKVLVTPSTKQNEIHLANQRGTGKRVLKTKKETNIGAVAEVAQNTENTRKNTKQKNAKSTTKNKTNTMRSPSPQVVRVKLVYRRQKKHKNIIGAVKKERRKENESGQIMFFMLNDKSLYHESLI